jgi:eukaryotic-like serine/threonine-protein kinase
MLAAVGGMVTAVTAYPTLEGLRITEYLATAGVSETYLAEQEPLGRRVVVRTLRPNVVPSSPFAGALLREAKLLGELSHPYVQQLLDFHRNECQMWLVLADVDGEPLSSILKKQGPLPPSGVACLLSMAAAALDHCHTRGVVHRAIQPQNVWLTTQGRLVLCNFVGAVKERLPTAPELLDGSHHMVVSPYFSPEQVLGETIDGRTDLFSLGVLLYEALTGQSPFDGEDERSVSQRIRKDVPAPPSRFASGIPGLLERIVQRCLEKMPADRFASSSELMAATETLLDELHIRSPENHLAALLLDPKASRTPSSLSQRTRPLFGVGRVGMTGLSVAGLVVCSGLIALGASLSEKDSRPDGTSSRRGSGRLELLPEQAGFLRIVAEPWAHVSIDGQLVGTTPLARPVALTPGTHFVHLEHPRAAVERRTVRIAAAGTILLDVNMNVAADPAPPPSSIPSDAGWSP